MKLSFSTKGWHNVSWEEFVFAAQDMGFDGIEIHNIHASAFSKKRGPADPAAAAATYRDLWGKKLTIPCINSITDLLSSQTQEEKCEEIKKCLITAKNLKVPYVRIHAIGHSSSFSEEEKDRLVKQIIDAVLPMAEENNIVLLMETMGFYANTEKLRNLLNDYASDYLAVLWDFQYPYRDNGESPQNSITNLGAYIKHVHIRDSEITNGNTEFCLIGEGSLPLDELMNALDSVSYDGFLSLEWDPAWMEELQDMSVIFPHFVNFMSRYDKKEEKKFLYTNKIHTGNYVWQKESLINCTFSDVLDRMAEEFPDQYMFKYTTLDYTRT